MSSIRSRKSIIEMEVVSTWRDLSPPGRFLRKDEETGLWNDIGDDDAAIKCSHVLREQWTRSARRPKQTRRRC